jgi:hypothetical protein
MITLENALAIVHRVRPKVGEEKVFDRFVAKTLQREELILVRLDEAQARFLGRQPGEIEVWLLVKDDPQSVFFDPFSADFGACWGPENETGRYHDLGARSDDPFAMYRL